MSINILKLIDNTNHFDLVFTGWGASTCILMIEMEKILLENQNILIIEPSDKLENDKHFVFGLKKMMIYIRILNQ